MKDKQGNIVNVELDDTPLLTWADDNYKADQDGYFVGPGFSMKGPQWMAIRFG